MPIGDDLAINLSTKKAIINSDVIAYETLDRIKNIFFYNEIDTKAELICIYNHLNTDKVIFQLDQGKTVCVLVDEGQSAFADPGGELVNYALNVDIEVDALPGPSSIMTAAAMSGYNLDHFVVVNVSSNIKQNENLTYILIEMQEKIQNFPKFLQDREITICSAIDMPSQKIWRGIIKDIGSQKVISKRGRAVVVIKGKNV